MKKNKIRLFIVAIAIIASAFIGGHEYFNPNPDMSTLNASFQNKSKTLLMELSTNDSAATKKYLGKVMVIKGTIRAIEKSAQDLFTVVLGDPGTASSVRCAIDSKHALELASLKEGSLAVVKGVFTGYNKDETGLLGSDAQLNRCIVMNK